MYVCVCTVCRPGASGGQKGALGLLKLELQAVVICDVGAEV